MTVQIGQQGCDNSRGNIQQINLALAGIVNVMAGDNRQSFAVGTPLDLTEFALPAAELASNFTGSDIQYRNLAGHIIIINERRGRDCHSDHTAVRAVTDFRGGTLDIEALWINRIICEIDSPNPNLLPILLVNFLIESHVFEIINFRAE